jgi:hypothetical protein
MNLINGVFLAKIQLLEAPKLTCSYLQLVPAEQQELSLFRAERGAQVAIGGSDVAQILNNAF